MSKKFFDIFNVKRKTKNVLQNETASVALNSIQSTDMNNYCDIITVVDVDSNIEKNIRIEVEDEEKSNSIEYDLGNLVTGPVRPILKVTYQFSF